MLNVIIYSKAHCPYCDLAKQFFTARGISYQEIRIDLDPHQLNEMLEKSKRRTVPQIFINNNHIGGYDDLAALAQSGKLQELFTL